MAIRSFLYAYIASEQEFAKDEVVVEEGSKGKWVYVILKGRAKVLKRTPKGKVTLTHLKEGDIIGEMSVFEQGESVRSATVSAYKGPLLVGLLDSERLISEYEALSPRLRVLTSTLMKRLRTVTDKVCTMAVEAK